MRRECPARFLLCRRWKTSPGRWVWQQYIPVSSAQPTRSFLGSCLNQNEILQKYTTSTLKHSYRISNKVILIISLRGSFMQKFSVLAVHTQQKFFSVFAQLTIKMGTFMSVRYDSRMILSYYLEAVVFYLMRPSR